jgi:hypothetical protein
VRQKIFKTRELVYLISFVPNRGAKQARNTRGVTTNPLKKNLVPRFRARIRKGENTISLLSRDYKRRLHDFEDYNSRGSRGITAKNKLIQFTTSLETDEDWDSGRPIGKRLSRTWRKPNRSRSKRLRTRTSRTLKPN